MATGLGTSPPFSSLPFLFLFLDSPIYPCPFPSFRRFPFVLAKISPLLFSHSHFALLCPVFTTTLPTTNPNVVVVRNCNPLMSRCYAFDIASMSLPACSIYSSFVLASVMFTSCFYLSFRERWNDD